MTVRTRFAPSPTGHLHIGGVRTALFNWLFARHHGGQYILRIDDTDQQRNLEQALQPILDGFRWLGLDWDEGPRRWRAIRPRTFSQRVMPGIERRSNNWSSAALPIGTTPRPKRFRPSVRRRSARNDGLSTVGGGWPRLTIKRPGSWLRGARPSCASRCRAKGVCALVDLVRGRVEFEWALEQDHVVQRADGSCLYHLASTIDDHDFRITHVIRAVEHLSNTPRQMFIAQALGYSLPHYAHLPYVAAPGSAQKLSKRKLGTYLKHPDFKTVYDHGVSIMAALGEVASGETFSPMVVDFYRKIGYRAEALLNYLLLLGWSLDDPDGDIRA